jgi:tRNA pseudouridine38-40 synthase
MYLIYLSFNGSRYHGWQFQENAVTIQETVHGVLEEILKIKLPYPYGCSRTDTGVHALEFLATLPNLYDIPEDALRKGMNSFLPDDIRVNRIEKRDGFQDPRYFVAGKHYRYLICRKETASPFGHTMSWHSPYPLDMVEMKKAMEHFVGTHDFTSFMSSGSEVRTTVRNISKARILETGDYLMFDYLGTGFLKHQIRIMSGTLAAVGRGRIKSSEIPSILQAKDRNLVPHTLPGKGLFLCKLFFSEEEMSSYIFPDTFKEMTW